MKRAQQGFTLIELVMVIVILGVLAAVAMPKFVNLKTDAVAAAAKGVAGGLSSANAVNYAGCAAKNNTVTANVCVKVTKCSEVAALTGPATTIATPAALPSPTVDGTVYVLTANDTSVTTGAGNNGTTVTCTASYGDGSTGVAMTYSATGAGN